MTELRQVVPAFVARVQITLDHTTDFRVRGALFPQTLLLVMSQFGGGNQLGLVFSVHRIEKKFAGPGG